MAIKVFLGGTCNGSKWRENFVSTDKIEYFHYDETLPSPSQEVDQHQLLLNKSRPCHILLHVLTPMSIDPLNIAVLISDSIKQPKKTILIIVKEDRDYCFDVQAWMMLETIKEMVVSNGAKCLDSFKEAIEYITSIANPNTVKYSDLVSDDNRCPRLRDIQQPKRFDTIVRKIALSQHQILFDTLTDVDTKINLLFGKINSLPEGTFFSVSSLAEFANRKIAIAVGKAISKQCYLGRTYRFVSAYPGKNIYQRTDKHLELVEDFMVKMFDDIFKYKDNYALKRK